MLRGGIALHCVPGAYEYKVAMGLRQLKVQLWGGGGASGHLKGQQADGPAIGRRAVRLAAHLKSYKVTKDAQNYK